MKQQPSEELKRRLNRRLKLNRLREKYHQKSGKLDITAPAVRDRWTHEKTGFDEPMGEEEFEFEMTRPFQRKG